MKKIFSTVFNIILFVGIIYAVFNFDKITNFIVDLQENFQYDMDLKNLKMPTQSTYNLKYSHNYVKENKINIPNNTTDIKNIIYTILNNGWSTFDYLCPKEYKNCIDDSLSITNNNVILSDINNFVHPYNSFSLLETAYTNNGKFTINIKKNYTNDDINIIEQKVNEIIKAYIKDSMSDREKIKTIHDYIINNTKYDNKYIEKTSNYKSNIAYGALIEGNAICSGYTDAMAIFLNKFNIPNYKISSSTHIWNLVYIDGDWKHLDLTFDDPVSNTNANLLEYDYFLITTNQLYKLDKDEHTFNEKVFSEAN